VAAKTGTAEISSATGRNNAWIVAFAPFKRPRYAFVVCLENVDPGVHGGDAAGPVLVEGLEHLSRTEPALKRGRP
jgi:cell division protein FtsI/penicillin-binding protein 2